MWHFDLFEILSVCRDVVETTRTNAITAMSARTLKSDSAALHDDIVMYVVSPHSVSRLPDIVLDVLNSTVNQTFSVTRILSETPLAIMEVFARILSGCQIVIDLSTEVPVLSAMDHSLWFASWLPKETMKSSDALFPPMPLDLSVDAPSLAVQMPRGSGRLCLTISLHSDDEVSGQHATLEKNFMMLGGCIRIITPIGDTIKRINVDTKSRMTQNELLRLCTSSRQSDYNFLPVEFSMVHRDGPSQYGGDVVVQADPYCTICRECMSIHKNTSGVECCCGICWTIVQKNEQHFRCFRCQTMSCTVCLYQHVE